mgnify:FL=1
MKKIFIAIPTLRSGGAERFATELACNINRDKFECSVIVTRKLDKTSAFYDKLINNGIRVIDISDSNYIKEVVNAVKLLRKEKPSIIHTNVGAALHMLAPIIISGTKSTHLFTAHSMGYRIFAGAKKRIVNVCFKKRWIIPVGICDTVKQSLVEAYHLKSSDVECVYNGVDTEIFYPCEKEKDDSKIVFVSTGTLYHIKNHELLIDAFSIVHKKYSNTVLRIIGDGELREQLKNQVKELGLSNSVIFEGNQSDVAPYLRKSDIYCCTSKVEGLPISVLEAMACGLPVITTPAGGVVDIVKDGESGFVVEADATLFSEKMIDLMKNYKLRNAMSIKSREYAERYSIKNCVLGYERLYDKYL